MGFFQPKSHGNVQKEISFFVPYIIRFKTVLLVPTIFYGRQLQSSNTHIPAADF